MSLPTTKPLFALGMALAVAVSLLAVGHDASPAEAHALLVRSEPGAEQLWPLVGREVAVQGVLRFAEDFGVFIEAGEVVEE